MIEPAHKNDKQKRRKKLIAESREQMAAKLSFTKTLKSIERIEDDLVEIASDEDLSAQTRIMAYREAKASYWKKIDKLLPDQRETSNLHEITGDLVTDITLRVIDGPTSEKP